MYYHEVYVASQKFHGSQALTYSSEELLELGAVVSVPLQRQKALGIVSKLVPKPAFTTKPITAVVSKTSIPLASLKLLQWLQDYYPAPLGFLTQLFLPATLLQTSRTIPAPKLPAERIKLPPLTPEQVTAYQAITEGNEKSFLLHGDTGSGKTRVYLELAASALSAGKSCIVLTPEIGLTPQLAKDFEDTFPGQVVTVHSTLTPAERRNAWQAINSARTPVIVIGPRSALFAPVHNLGYVIIDEIHDSAYKQEQAPYYQASRVAAQLAHLNGAKLVMGSATPSVSDYYLFDAKKLPILRMQKSAIETSHHELNTSVVDLKDRSQFTRSPWLSNKLIEEINVALEDQSQSLIFLNRRGTARLVLCQNCGWQATCPKCDLPLTYHGDTHRMQCHTCGHNEQAVGSCPTCKSADIVFKSIGTKTLVGEIEKLFPRARVQRFDSDSIKSERLEQHYEAIKAGEVDILVGTQMLSKGLDLPKLAVVGVVVADTSLYFPDYTANERTFQLLNQVIGRVGRGHRSGTIVVQTYQPESGTIKNAVSKNYSDFYQQEIQERQLFRFPPFYYLLKLSVSRASHASARKSAESLHETLRTAGLNIEVSSPTPAFTERVNNQYRWQLVVKARTRGELTKLVALLPSGWTYDLDPSHLL